MLTSAWPSSTKHSTTAEKHHPVANRSGVSPSSFRIFKSAWHSFTMNLAISKEFVTWTGGIANVFCHIHICSFLRQDFDHSEGASPARLMEWGFACIVCSIHVSVTFLYQEFDNIPTALKASATRNGGCSL
mmetsp:Transcript_17823/g.38797  ORF Transcript_17823/g.38797 Transcript_17823/m.38797 type:complete len:131 (-) Transcript_17823:515-907(-)